MREARAIVIHCSATRENVDYTEKELARDHAKRGIRPPGGYDYYIRKDGTIVVMRAMKGIGAHARGYNKTTVSICYEGGLDSSGKAKDTRTEAQKASILKVIKSILRKIKKAGRPLPKKIVGHRDLSEDKNNNGVIDSWERMKECPCYDAIPEYSWILA